MNQNVKNFINWLKIFIDLSKVFDTVNHSILINKVKKQGFRSFRYSWFMSYLNNKVFLSSSRQMSSSVPQGSILGSLLFICYINNIPSITHHSSTFLYAVGMAVLVKGKNVQDIKTRLEKDLYGAD